MPERPKNPLSTDALDKTLHEILAAEPVLEGRNGQLLQSSIEEFLRELLQDGQFSSKLLSETKMGLGMGLGKFLAWKVWNEIEKSDKRKLASRSKPNLLTLSVPKSHFGSVKGHWSAIREAFQSRVGFVLPEPTVVPIQENRFALEMREGLLGLYELVDEDWLEPLVQFLASHASKFLTLNDVKHLMETVRSTSPVVIEELERQRISMVTVYWVLTELLQEGVSIAELEVILTAIALQWEQRPYRSSILSAVRQALAPWICKKHQSQLGVLRALKVGKNIEALFAEGYSDYGGEPTFTLENSKETAIASLVKQALNQLQSAEPLVVLTNNVMRRQLRALLRKDLPGVAVLSETEIGSSFRIEVVAVVDIRQLARTDNVTTENRSGVSLP